MTSVTPLNFIDYFAAATSRIGPQARGAKRRVLRISPVNCVFYYRFWKLVSIILISHFRTFVVEQRIRPPARSIIVIIIIIIIILS